VHEIPLVRARGDAELRDKLLADAEVKTAIAGLPSDQADTQRHLLATAVRMSSSMSPRLDRILRQARERLRFDDEVEIYIYANASYNAHCMMPSKGRGFVLLTSGLYEAFDDAELAFVIGHELGHHLYAHREIPVASLSEKLAGPEALSLFAWSRYAEISADRVGLVVSGDLNAASRAFLKLASGLHQLELELTSSVLLEQLKDLEAAMSEPGARSPSSEWYTTHPFSPLRVKALVMFHESSLYAGAGRSADDLEAGLRNLMSIMEPNYLDEKTDAAEAMRRYLFAGGVLVASADGEVAPEEIAVLERFLGPGSVSRTVNADAIRRDLDRRAAAMNAEVHAGRRGQVIRDLCLVAKADGRIPDSERTVLLDLATRVGVDAMLVDQALGHRAQLD